jgi:hypothetical protein
VLKLREEEMNLLQIITLEELKSLPKYRIPEKDSKVEENPKLVAEE